MMLPRKLLLLCLNVVPVVRSQLEQPPLRARASLSFSNRTTSSTLPSTQTSVALSSIPSSTSSSDPIKLSKDPGRSAVCCFVVQDTISEEWWDIASTSSTYGLVNVTAVTTYVTRGPDGLGTIIGSNSSVIVTNTSFMFSYNVGVNPLATLFNAAPGPSETDSPLTGTATMTGGELVKSPEAFYVYNSVKIITAAAVYDEDGNIMCATTSKGFLNINSNAEAYFGGPSIAGNSISESTYETVLSTTLTFFEPTPFTTTPTTTATLVSKTTYYINSDNELVTPPPRQPGVVISLTAPFIYQPPWGETGALEPTGECVQASALERYGYIPQTLLDFLIQEPAYSAQYPGLKGCVPGGPSIILQRCFLIPPTTAPPPLPSTVAIPAGGGLTSSATVYVMPNVMATPAPSDTQLEDTAPTSAAPAPKQTPPSNPDPSPNSIGAIINSILGNSPPLPPGQSAGFSTQVIGGTPVLVIPGPTTIPLSLAPSGLQGSTTAISGTTFLSVPASTTLPNPASNPLPNPGGIFSSSIVGGSTVLVVPQTTIPLAQAPPGLQGSTVMQDGTTMLVVPGPTTVPLPADSNGAMGPVGTTIINGIAYLLIPSPTAQQLPGVGVGVLTTIDGQQEWVLGPTTVPVSALGGLDVSGRTTVIGGITEVVISGSTTVGLKTGSSAAASVGVSVSVLTTTVVVTSSTPTTKKNAGGTVDVGWKEVIALLGVMMLILR